MLGEWNGCLPLKHVKEKLMNKHEIRLAVFKAILQYRPDLPLDDVIIEAKKAADAISSRPDSH